MICRNMILPPLKLVCVELPQLAQRARFAPISGNTDACASTKAAGGVPGAAIDRRRRCKQCALLVLARSSSRIPPKIPHEQRDRV
jgi:hypothetical protein